MGEIHIARVGRGDDWLAQPHRLRQNQTESLRAVQGNQAVAGSQQSVHFPARHDLIEDGDGIPSAHLLQEIDLVRLFIPIIHLDHQVTSGFLAKRQTESFDYGRGVLPLEDTQDVEYGDKQKLVGGQTEMRPSQGRGERRLNAVRHAQDGNRRLAADGPLAKRAGGPDLVNVRKGALPAVGEVFQLPGPVADIVFAGEEFPPQSVEY